jgi:high-affinity iron transporter
MNDASLGATLIVVFREGLEAGLIVGIILTVLARLGAWRYSRHVWLSTAAAIVASAGVWGLLQAATTAAQGRWNQVIEAVISLVACGVLTYMVFWMDRQAKRIRPELEEHVATAVSSHEAAAMVALPFIAVFREGAETALFLQAVAIQSGGTASLVGGLLGAALAVAVTLAIFVGGRQVPLRPLFRWTGLLLLLMAAGMLAYGIHEMHELQWLPPLVDPIWNINHLLSDKQGIGSFLKALFGYNGNPSLLEVLAYGTYLAVVITQLRRRPQAGAR